MTTQRWKRPLVAILFQCAVFSVDDAGAQSVFKCEGENGETVFSQRPCSESAETVEVAPTNSSAPPSAEAGRVYSENAQQRRFDQIDRRYEREIRQIEEDSCRRAQSRLASAQDRWRQVKRSGYTAGDENYYNQIIRDRQTFADEMCR